MTIERAPKNLAGRVMSAALFVLASGLFVFVLWRTVGPRAPRGEWREEYHGIQLGDLSLSGREPDSGGLRHPAVIYFHDAECRPCEVASERFGQHLVHRVDTDSAGGTSYYIIEKPGSFVPDSAEQKYPPPVEVYVVVGSNPSLAFVRDFPMFAATDSAGQVMKVYVGIPDREVFDQLEAGMRPVEP